MIYLNKIENMVTFKTKTGYYNVSNNEITWKTKSKITKDKNSEKMPHLEIAKVVLIHYNIVNHDYQQDSKVLYTFIPNKSFDQLLDFSPKIFIFKNFHILKYGLPIKILN